MIFRLSSFFLSSCLFVSVSELFCCELLKAFVILPSYELATTSVILLPIKSPVASPVLFEGTLNGL